MSFAPSGIRAGHIVHVLFDCTTWAAALVLLVCVTQAVLHWGLSLQMQDDSLSGNLSFPKPYVKQIPCCFHLIVPSRWTQKVIR